MEKQKTRNVWLDLFRFVLIFMVINIHFNQSSLFLPIFRMAVPMFFMISGYFSYSNDLTIQTTKNIKLIKSSIKYLIFGYAVSLLCGLVLLIWTGNISNGLFPYSYHLWFLLSLFLVSCMHFLICKWNIDKIYLYIIPILIVLALFLNGYIKFLNVNIPLEVTRNSIFTGLPMFAIGYVLKKYNIKVNFTYSKIIIFFCAIVFLFLSLLESKIVVMEYYLCSVLSAICFVVFFTSLNVKQSKPSLFFYKYIGANASFFIYICHVVIGELIKLTGLKSWGGGISINPYSHIHIVRNCILDI